MARIFLPEAPDEPIELTPEENETDEALVDRARRQRAAKSVAEATQKKLAKEVKPVSAMSRPIFDDYETNPDGTLKGPSDYAKVAAQGVAQGLTGALGGAPGGIPGMMLGGISAAMFGDASPADLLMNMVPSPRLPSKLLSRLLPGMKGAARPVVEEAVKEVLPNATPYANAVKGRLADFLRGGATGATEALARQAAHTALKSGEAEISPTSALIGGVLGGVAGAGNIKPIEKTKFEQAREALTDLQSKHSGVAKNINNLNVTREEAKLAKEKLKENLLTSISDTRVKAKEVAEKSFSDTRAKLQEELQGKQGELEELNKNLLTNSGDELRKRRGELVRETKSEDFMTRDQVQAELAKERDKQLKSASTKYETAKRKLSEAESALAKEVKPSGDPKADAAARKALETQRDKAQADMAKARENVQILMEDEDNILPTKKVEGIFAKSARSKPIEKELEDINSRIGPLRDVFNETREKITLTKDQISKLEAELKPFASATPTQYDTYVARKSKEFLSSPEVTENLKKLRASVSGKRQEELQAKLTQEQLKITAQEIEEQAGKVGAIFGKDPDKVRGDLVGNLVGSLYMGATTGPIRAALATLGHALGKRNPEEAARVNKALSRVLGSEKTRAINQSMKSIINAIDNRERERRDADFTAATLDLDEDEGDTPSPPRNALMDAIARKEGLYSPQDDVATNIPKRLNNPGGLRDIKGNFMQFNSVDEGFDGLEQRLSQNAKMRIADYIAKHAPTGDGNDPQKYLQDVLEELQKKGIPANEDTLIEELLRQ